MALWYVDRSRYELGLGRCLRARYLRYHSGPSGYGMQRKAESMPLIVGGRIHDALAPVLLHVQQTDQLPTDEAIRSAILFSTTEYGNAVRAHGMQQVGEVDKTALNLLIREQTALLTGLVWSWCLEVLPWVHHSFRIISVEQEEELVLGCTCGLGDSIGTFADHEARGCNGIGVMGRGDFLADLRESPGTFSYHEFKTTSYSSERWESEWETKLQFALGMLGSERRLGVEFSEHYVHGLFKGARRRQRADGDVGRSYTGPKIQDSPLVHAWCKPAAPPFETDEWAAQYDWVDEFGKGRRLGKGWTRRPVWEYMLPVEVEAGYDPVEYWVRFIPEDVRRKQLQLVGPMNRQAVMLAAIPTQLIGHETQWRDDLFELYEAAAAIGPMYWTDPTFQRTLDSLIPQSWECRRYGKEHRCEFERVCFHEPGWEDPLGSTVYVLRRPLHEHEMSQMKERGLEPTAEETSDEPED